MKEGVNRVLKIANIEMKNPVVLAPMAGVCNSAFRLTVKEFGAGLVCAEMVSDKAILLNNKRTLDMLYIDERKAIKFTNFWWRERNSCRCCEIRRSIYDSRHH